MKNTFYIPSRVTSQIFNKITVQYNPQHIWGIFNDLSNGQSMNQQMTDDLFDFFLSMGILVILQKYPDKPVQYEDGFLTNGHQVDELMDVVIKLHDYFVDKPERVTADKYFPEVPSTEKDERRFHAHFKKKGGNLWTDGYRKRTKDPLGRYTDTANKSYGEGEDAEGRRTDFYNEVMSETPDYLMCKTATGYSTDLTKCCTSEDMFKVFTDKATETHRTIVTNELLKKFCRDSEPKEISSLVKSILNGFGYKISDEVTDDKYTIFYNGKVGRFRSQEVIHSEGVVKGSKHDSAVIFNFTDELSGQMRFDIETEMRAQNRTHPTIIAFKGRSEDHLETYPSAYKKSSTMDLLDLAKLIKDEFDKLTESEQERVQKLIEDLAKDF